MNQSPRLVLLVLAIAGLASVGLASPSRSVAPRRVPSVRSVPTATTAPAVNHSAHGLSPPDRCRPLLCVVGKSGGFRALHRRRLVPFRLAHARNTGHLTPGIALTAHGINDVFGVGAFVTQRSNSLSRLVVGRVRLLGARWVREEFTATRLHSGSDSPYHWAPFDRVVHEERRAGIHILGLLDYSNTWGYANHGWMPHADMRRLRADFARYAYAVARHYRGQIDFWQVWNEPNLKVFWHPAPNPGDYAQLVNVAYPAIKRGNPRARVVLAGMSGVDLDFLRRITRQTHAFDIISVHPYRNEPEYRLLEQIRTLRQWHKPIWFSEVGWAAGPGCDLCTDESAQARYLARFYALSAAAGVQRVFWYDLRDDTQPASSPEAHFGLMRQDLSGKPAFAAYSFLSRLLRNAIFVRADDAGSRGVYALRFDLRTSPLTMLWTVGGSDQTVAFPWPLQYARAYGLDGVSEGDVTVRGGQASWTVPSDGTPVYVMASSIFAPFHLPGALLHPRPHLPARHLALVTRLRRVVRRVPRKVSARIRPRKQRPIPARRHPKHAAPHRIVRMAARPIDLASGSVPRDTVATEHRMAVPTAAADVRVTATAMPTVAMGAATATPTTPTATVTVTVTTTATAAASATPEADQRLPSPATDATPSLATDTTTSPPVAVTP